MGIGGVNPVGLDYVCQNKDHYVGTVGFFPENWPNFLLPALMASAQGATRARLPGRRSSCGPRSSPRTT